MASVEQGCPLSPFKLFPDVASYRGPKDRININDLTFWFPGPI